jgi:hypothetical protein
VPCNGIVARETVFPYQKRFTSDSSSRRHISLNSCR